MRAGSTVRPSSRARVWCSAPALSAKACGSASHSACQGPVARSWSCSMASSITATSWRTFFAAARMSSLAIGLRFCGMVLLPPRPSACGSATSPTSVCIRRAVSVAILPSEPVRRPRKQAASARPSRATCQAIGGTARPSSPASAASTRVPSSPSEASVPTAPPNWTTRISPRSVSRRRRWRCMALSQTAHLKPKVIGKACCRWLRPAIGVSRNCRESWTRRRRTASRSASISARASRICSTSALSTMSWVVAPQCT